MKTIGIFTYKHSNYGAVLQCFALQRYLRNQSEINVEVVNFTTSLHYQQDQFFRRWSNNPIKQIAYMLLTLYRLPSLFKRRTLTKKFKLENIQWSKLYSSEHQLLEDPPKYDVYCTGSDQVFNLSGNYKNIYFLNFDTNNGRKVAYAPSLGSTPLNQDTAVTLLSLLNNFHALSCREADGAQFLSEITKSDVPQVLDPTLLLTKEDWLKVSKRPNFCGDYILVYDLNGRHNLISIAKRVQAQHHMPIFCITDKVEAFYHVDKQIYGAGPSEFLGLFAGAKYVITDSFHGTVFSIIFNKPFSSYIALPKSSSRILSLLKNLGLEEHIITHDTLTKDRQFSIQEINVDQRLELLRAKSYEFIKRNIIF